MSAFCNPQGQDNPREPGTQVSTKPLNLVNFSNILLFSFKQIKINGFLLKEMIPFRGSQALRMPPKLLKTKMLRLDKLKSPYPEQTKD